MSDEKTPPDGESAIQRPNEKREPEAPGELKNDLVASVKLASEFTLRAGKKMVRVSVEG